MLDLDRKTCRKSLYCTRSCNSNFDYYKVYIEL